MPGDDKQGGIVVAASPRVERPRVLLIEGDVETNRFVAQCLASEYDVASAFDGRQGLDRARELLPALIMIAVTTPNLSGLEVLQQLGREPALKATPVLVLSAEAEEESTWQLLDEGARDFVVKPFSERELRVRVKNLMAAERAQTELRSLRDAAEGAIRAKDEFLAILGHELRNPLAPILTALRVMQMRGELGSEAERLVIERQVNHLTRLVDDLLDVSRVARGKVELRTEPIEIAEIVARAIEMASPLLEQRTHALSLRVPEKGLLVDGDKLRLSQVVSNLLTNAAKYTPPRGDILIRAKQVDDEVVLTVRDTGIGIAPEALPRIFDLFVQEHQALDRSQGGLGIGLSIVRNLVEAHRGSVSAASAGLGKGVEMTVRLPILPAGTPRPVRPSFIPPPQPNPDAARAPRRILLVDDNEDSALMLAEILSAKGYEARVAYDAPSALRVAAEFAPETAFLDIGLPVMDGYELAAHLRRLPGLAGIKLIALTGYGQASDRRRTREAGFQHHLVKPIDIDAIDQALSTL